MGSSCSSQTNQISKTIDKQMKKDDATEKRMIKLLLLGPGESGKSTILKQMQILHKDGFSESQLKELKPLIYSNIYNSIFTIVSAMEEFNIPFSDPSLKVQSKIIFNIVESKLDNLPLSEQLADAVKSLWGDNGVQQCYLRRSEYQLTDGAKYFLDNLERICSSDYNIPTYQDALYVRAATIGIVQISFTAKNTEFQVYDVGGQRSERRKWIHCFDNVNALIFVCAISEYDQVLREDHTTNRMHETLTLFETLINCDYFAKTTAILFLNKRDLFAEKIVKTSIKSVFPDYDGAQTYDEAVPFIRTKFRELNKNLKRTIKVHETCATDTNQVKLVIHGTIETIIKENMKDAGVL